MTQSIRWTTDDLDVFPLEDGKRYEIIDGELYVSTQPSYQHQRVSGRLFRALDAWDDQTGAGEVNTAPGVIFAIDDAVAPDVVWISRERLPSVLGRDGKLHAAPDLVVEVLSPGSANQKRDRDIKLRLYNVRGVLEYWIVDWIGRRVEVYRREQGALQLAGTMLEADALASPLLPGFSYRLEELFAGLAPLPAEG